MNMIAIANNATMSSFDLLTVLNAARADHGESEVRRNDFVARIRDELEGEHYETFVVANANGTQSMGAMLSHDQCLLVLMRESKAVRRQALDAIKSKTAAPAVALPNFTDPAEAAIAWANEFKAKREAQEALALAAPKVEFVDRYVTADSGAKGLREVCKILKANERHFTAFLNARQIMYRLAGNLTPYAPHIDAGRFVVKTGEANGHAFSTAKFTPKGVEWIAGEWAKWQLVSDQEAA
jgi:phage antirepressor YoqD-like protein